MYLKKYRERIGNTDEVLYAVMAMFGNCVNCFDCMKSGNEDYCQTWLGDTFRYYVSALSSLGYGCDEIIFNDSSVMPRQWDDIKAHVAYGDFSFYRVGIDSTKLDREIGKFLSEYARLLNEIRKSSDKKKYLAERLTDLFLEFVDLLLGVFPDIDFNQVAKNNLFKRGL
jgi:hypothetical protein